jgi:hypothetical protein
MPANTDLVGVCGEEDDDVAVPPLGGGFVIEVVVSAVFWKKTFSDRTVPGLIESMIGSLRRTVSVLGIETRFLVEFDAEGLL